MKNIVKILLMVFVAASLYSCKDGGSKKNEETKSNQSAVNTEKTETATGNTPETPAEPQKAETIRIDGSSTVAPISEAVAEEYSLSTRNRVTVGISGTGGGFKKFCVGETDISDASRPIKDKEVALCAENNVEYEQITVAFDGITVVINPENDFVDYLTVEELNKIWAPDSTLAKWSEVRDGWPDEEIILYGPGTDSGTFDYFTDAINGDEGASRSDYQASEDDNHLVMGVGSSKYALGYFGYAYYVENTDSLKAVAVDGGNGPVEPNDTTINDGSYSPLSRPIFIYVNIKRAKERPEVKEFVNFYLDNAAKLVPTTGYISLNGADYQSQLLK